MIVGIGLELGPMKMEQLNGLQGLHDCIPLHPIPNLTTYFSDLIFCHFPPLRCSSHTGFLIVPQTHMHTSASFPLHWFFYLEMIFYQKSPYLGPSLRVSTQISPYQKGLSWPPYLKKWPIPTQLSVPPFPYVFFRACLSPWHMFIYFLPLLDCKLHEGRNSFPAPYPSP